MPCATPSSDAEAVPCGEPYCAVRHRNSPLDDDHLRQMRTWFRIIGGASTADVANRTLQPWADPGRRICVHGRSAPHPTHCGAVRADTRRWRSRQRVAERSLPRRAARSHVRLRARCTLLGEVIERSEEKTKKTRRTGGNLPATSNAHALTLSRGRRGPAQLTDSAGDARNMRPFPRWRDRTW